MAEVRGRKDAVGTARWRQQDAQKHEENLRRAEWRRTRHHLYIFTVRAALKKRGATNRKLTPETPHQFRAQATSMAALPTITGAEVSVLPEHREPIPPRFFFPRPLPLASVTFRFRTQITAPIGDTGGG